MHDAILEDLCYPSEIVGKRIRMKLDGSRLIKVHLDKTQQTNIEHKVSSSRLTKVHLNRTRQTNLELKFDAGSILACIIY